MFEITNYKNAPKLAFSESVQPLPCETLSFSLQLYCLCQSFLLFMPQLLLDIDKDQLMYLFYTKCNIISMQNKFGQRQAANELLIFFPYFERGLRAPFPYYSKQISNTKLLLILCKTFYKECLHLNVNNKGTLYIAYSS